MNKPNITPGPWAANVDTVWTGRSSHLMTCFPLHDEQSRANAQAIAALPDLLAALEQMKPIIEAFLQDELSITTIQEAGNIFHDVYLPALIKAGYTF